MASDFKPDFNSKALYAGASDEYDKLVLEKCVPTLEHPLPPISPQYIPVDFASKYPVK